MLSTDLYKVYANPLLDRVSSSMIGGRVGEINCAEPTCADDITRVSENERVLQSLIDDAADYARMERYQGQPAKSVVMPVKAKKTKPKQTSNFT